MENFLVPFTWLALFAGCLLKGEALFVAALFASERAYFDLPLVLSVVFVAAVSTDHLFYFIGRNKSRDVLWNRPDLIPFAEDLYEKLKHNPLRVFISHQFLNGFTQKVPYVTGTSNLKPFTFAWCNIVATLIWIISLFSVTFLLNLALAGILGAGYYESELLFGVLVAGLLIQLALYVWRERSGGELGN